MADYRLTLSTTVFREADSAYIPADPSNLDWQQYQEWLAAGNTPDPYVLPPVNTITNSQLARQLDAIGKLETVEQLVAAAGGLTQKLWNSAATFNISDPMVTGLALNPAPQGLGMTQAQLQDFFNAASKL